MKGESIKKMNSIIDMLQFNEQVDKNTIIQMLTEIMRIETPTTAGKFDLFKYIAYDKLRPVMNCVYHDNGFKVVSDSHILFVVKEDYPEEYEGKMLHKDGTFEENRRYPKYNVLRPREERMGIKVSIDAAFEAEKIRKADKKLHLNMANGSDYVCLAVVGEDRELKKVYYKTEHFAKFATFMKAYGIDTILINPNRINYAAYATNGESWGVVMPVLAPDNEDLPNIKQLNI